MSRTKTPTHTIDPITGCWNWSRPLNRDGYGQFTMKGKTHMAHRYYWELQHGPIPDGMQLDHKCRNEACVNPHPDHLRVVTPQQNKFYAKKRKAASSAFKGVYYRATKGKWGAQIMLNGTKHNLGTFASEIDAALAYDKAAHVMFGEFAYLNFPDCTNVQNAVQESYSEKGDCTRTDSGNSMKLKEAA